MGRTTIYESVLEIKQDIRRSAKEQILQTRNTFGLLELKATSSLLLSSSVDLAVI